MSVQSKLWALGRCSPFCAWRAYKNISEWLHQLSIYPLARSTRYPSTTLLHRTTPRLQFTMLAHILLAAVTASLASAHFILQWPETAGFIDDSEPDSPCGGATVYVHSSSPQIQVDQFAISIMSTHPEGEWQFRATTDTQPPYNFTDAVPVVNTTGIGSFCLPFMSVPAEFAGKGGVIQVIDNSIDGNLYQVCHRGFT